MRKAVLVALAVLVSTPAWSFSERDRPFGFIIALHHCVVSCQQKHTDDKVSRQSAVSSLRGKMIIIKPSTFTFVIFFITGKEESV